ncbi:hypothetical protein [Aurantimonas sp. VKM B-3413]|uniref:hypothetical protein n=1 Tax=Aurantimonas sp. VKM B-3413 TaxID=2779401 RepID=UPI001E5B012D|nr:hypothetical protein [Aurantimonas sp. VKM B-3413]MCB8838029.1 hypothetical protein [Aurantimonas sp. VKM B-3413]
MTRLEQIERDVSALSAEDLAKFRAWFERYDSDRFDAAIERDTQSGALDRFADAALAEFTAGRTRRL